MKELNILIVGVGGQGVILMSELLGKVAVREGLQVRGSEVLGMAVRGGSVTSTIRIGSEVYGPLTPQGKGNILLGMEPVEALRHAPFLSPSGLVIVNTRKVVPFTSTLGEKAYPALETIITKLKTIAREVVPLNIPEISHQAGSMQAANIVMLGALFATGKLPIKIETMKEELQSHFSPRLVPTNIKAFDLGYGKYKEVSGACVD